jgi:uncharacterized integral membrane protein (TIGR00697 family)
MRQRFGKSKLWFRNNISNIIAQLIDTSVFMILAFYAFDKSFAHNFSFILGLIVPYWLLKCAMSVFGTPFTYLGIGWLEGSNEGKTA